MGTLPWLPFQVSFAGHPNPTLLFLEYPWGMSGLGQPFPRADGTEIVESLLSAQKASACPKSRVQLCQMGSNFLQL